MLFDYLNSFYRFRSLAFLLNSTLNKLGNRIIMRRFSSHTDEYKYHKLLARFERQEQGRAGRLLPQGQAATSERKSAPPEGRFS